MTVLVYVMIYLIYKNQLIADPPNTEPSCDRVRAPKFSGPTAVQSEMNCRLRPLGRSEGFELSPIDDHESAALSVIIVSQLHSPSDPVPVIG